MIINAGIQRVVYAGHYPDENAVAFMTEAGVCLERYPVTTAEAAAADQADEGEKEF